MGPSMPSLRNSTGQEDHDQIGIGVCATDPARLVVFYRALGFSEAYENDSGVMMIAGDIQLFLFATRQPESPPMRHDIQLFGTPPEMQHISIAVTDVDAIYAKLRETGVACCPPQSEPWGSRMVSFKDPDGNNLYVRETL
jgi:catechol 2,3-dioxygenase-like lactoylglutathione lyase family enzyme